MTFASRSGDAVQASSKTFDCRPLLIEEYENKASLTLRNSIDMSINVCLNIENISRKCHVVTFENFKKKRNIDRLMIKSHGVFFYRSKIFVAKGIKIRNIYV